MPVKEAEIRQKNVAQAIGIASAPTTTSNAAVPCPDMSVTHYSTARRIKISYSLVVNTTGSFVASMLYMNGVQVSSERNITASSSNNVILVDSIIVFVAPNQTNKIDLYWRTSSGSPTMTANTTLRTLIVEEI